MSDEKKQKGLFKSLAELSFVKKLKSIKHIEVIIVSIFAIVLLLICFGGNNIFGFLKSSSTNQATVTTDSTSQTYVSTSKYVESLEKRIKSVLSQMQGTGNVEVMVSVSSSVELEFATDDTITTSGQTMEKESKIILVEIDGEKKPIVISEKMPEISGIVVVSSGAKDTKVKLDIISAIQTLLKLDSSKIEVFVGK